MDIGKSSLMTGTFLLVLAFSGCSGSGATSSPPTGPPVESNLDQTPPVLKNLGVAFGPWDPANHRAGSFPFQDEYKAQVPLSWRKTGGSLFLEFGAVVDAKTLPTFEYRVLPDTDVVAVSNGVVTNISAQGESGSSDFEIHIQPVQNSAWTVGYDHVDNPTVAVGETVTAGQILGKASLFMSFSFGDLHRTELQVFNVETKLDYCPMKFFDPDLAAAFGNQVRQLMQDWETFNESSDIYDEAAMVYPGCRSETFKE